MEKGHIGTDESGKGDYFGPLVVAGVYVPDKQQDVLKELGVKDSKRFSDNRVREMAALVKKGYKHSIIVGSGSKSKFSFEINDEKEMGDFENKSNILIATDAISRSQDFPFASVVINIDLPWNPAVIKQRIMRCRRVGSKHKTIFAFNLVSEGTIEEAVLPVLERKMKLAEDVIDKNEYQLKDELRLDKLLGVG